MRSDELAASIVTNPSVVRALLMRLGAAGLTRSQMGSGGGSLLAKPPEVITLLDAYLAVDDGEIFSFHRSRPDNQTIVGRHIIEALVSPLQSARDVMERRLAAITISDILEKIRKLELKN